MNQEYGVQICPIVTSGDQSPGIDEILRILRDQLKLIKISPESINETRPGEYLSGRREAL